MIKKNNNFSKYQCGQANALMIGILATILILALIGLGAIYLTTKNIINPQSVSKKINNLLGQTPENQPEQINTELDQSRVIDPEKDSDGDGVPDEAEIAMGTDPFKAESLPQFVENKLPAADPEKDSDGDGVPDEAEMAMGTDPNKAEETVNTPTTTQNKLPAADPEKDSDGDGVPDEAEIAMGTDPFNK